jgi:hypothetical protein
MPSATLSRPGRLQWEPQPEVASLLWSPVVVARWASAAGLAGLVIVGSWFVIGGKATWDDQRPWMALAIAGLVAVAFVSLNVLLAGRRAIGVRRVQLLGDLPAPRQDHSVRVSAPSVVAGPASEVLVAGEGLVRYHRSDCVLTDGRDYAAADRAAHRAAGRQQCGVCLP